MDFPFTTDGCSGRIWLTLTGREGPWRGCCVEHDKAYWQGGTRAARAQADIALMACVARNGHPVIAFAMWAAVRIGGHPLWPFPWRWGYGWKYPRGYRDQ